MVKRMGMWEKIRKFFLIKWRYAISSLGRIQISNNAFVQIAPNGLQRSKQAIVVIGHERELEGYWPSRLLIQRGAVCRIAEMLVVHEGCSIKLHPGAVLNVHNLRMNSGSEIDCHYHIEIGQGVTIGFHCFITDGGTHGFTYKEHDNAEKNMIKIEDNAWIATRCVILKGVTIGEGAVVGAGSVVTKDVPPYSFVAGVPAKVIRENVRWEYTEDIPLK